MILRDPVHGDIYFTELDRSVIDTPEMQRLRGIKQLGTGYLVYPGAVHTRFEHSLGTAGVAKRIVHHLRHRHPEMISPEDEAKISILALIHDITHIPFGHTFEDEMKIFDRHDKRSRYKEILDGTAVGDILEKMNFYDQAIALLSSTNASRVDEPWMMQIVTETLCADLLDYLRRDSYYCGIKKDYDDRIFNFLDLYIDDSGRKRYLLNMTKNNILRTDIRSEVLHLLKVRYFLTERVYYHHAKISSGAMISKALAMARRDYGLEKADLYNHSDFTLLEHLKAMDKEGIIRRIIDNVMSRRLLKRAYVLTTATLPAGSGDWYWLVSQYHYPTGMREKLETEIAETLGIDTSDVVVYCMGPTHFKEARMDVLTPEGIMSFDEMKGIEELEAMKRMYENLWRFYVFTPGDLAGKAGRVVEDILGIENEYRSSG